MSPQDLKHQISSNEEEDNLAYAVQFAASSISTSVLKAAIELELFDIIDKHGKESPISCDEIANHLPKKTPDTASVIDRMLLLLASYKLFTCTVANNSDGNTQRLYGLAPAGKYLAKNEDGVSIAPLVKFWQTRGFHDIWYHLKDFVLEGGSPSQRAHGMEFFERSQEDDHIFNEAMRNHTTIIMNTILQKYDGFHDIKELVDVGGGFGANLKLIVSKHPHIQGINFDLPHVIKDAPPVPGVKHVDGDMFQQVPKGEAFFIKWILHNWDDEHCVKLLKNCYEALPESGGKVIVMDAVLPEYPNSDNLSKVSFIGDNIMFVINPGAKERTLKEFNSLAKMAGFESIAVKCEAHTHSVIELNKKPVN